MSAYYNEFDAKKAAWLRELISRGLIASGEVDERSIVDVRADDLRGYTQCHFFAGIGVWSHALRSAGWEDTRQVWTGSCPCQGFSVAGKKKGFADERHLWPWWSRLIAECRPSVVFGEQSASKDALTWLDLVQSDLEAQDYAVGTLDICAAGLGAPHIRQRLYFVADTLRPGRSERRTESGEGQVAGSGCVSAVNGFWSDADWIYCRDEKYRPVETGTFPLAHGAPARVGRLRGYGDAIVAPLAQAFIEAYMSITE